MLTRSRIAGSLGKAFPALALVPFRFLMVGTILYMAGSVMDTTARAWLAYNLTGSGLALGAVALASGVTQMVVALFSGAVADRFDKRRILVITQMALFLISLLSALLVQLGLMQIWQLMVLGFLSGAATPFSYPARQAYIPVLVGKELLPSAISVDSMARSLNRVVTPALVAILLGWHPSAGFWAIAACNLGAVLTLLRLPSAPTLERAKRAVLADVAFGLRYVWNHPALRVLTALSLAVSVLALPIQQLLPVVQVSMLHVTPTDLGIMYFCFGIGGFAGALSSAAFSKHRQRELLQTIFGIVLAASLILLGFTSHLTLAEAVLVAVGFGSQSFMTLNQVLVMVNTRPELYGRVGSINFLANAMLPFAMMPIGAFVDLSGVGATLIVLGSLFLVTVIALSPMFLRRMGSATVPPPIST
jgi:MFS family permease